jgi:carboxymethylenebutenolidase
MPAYNTVTERITLKGHNGEDVEAYTARPTDPGTYPGVVVIHHLPGWDAWTREIVRKFADAGYNAISPHLFSRWMPASEGELRKKAFETWGPPDPQVMGDVAASARYLKGLPNSNGRAGCIGFCSGGRQAYLAASQVEELDAAVDCWGGAVIPDERFSVNEMRPISPFEATKDIQMPLMGIFGNDDVFPPPAQVDQIEAELQKYNKDYEFYRYDGCGHGFWANAMPMYRAEATQDSWAKVMSFYDKHLHMG